MRSLKISIFYLILLQECVLTENHVSFEIKILFHFEDIHFILKINNYLLCFQVPMSSSTPNSSVSNMACLPEVDPELVAFGEDHTGVHPSQVAAVTRQVRSTNAIYF